MKAFVKHQLATAQQDIDRFTYERDLHDERMHTLLDDKV